MIEVYGNLWDQEGPKCITTNGFIKNNGEAVMGRGVAAEAARFYPLFPEALGALLKEHGNHVFYVQARKVNVEQMFFTFPVKHNWFEKADLELIRQSCIELEEKLAQHKLFVPVYLPRPGCGNGGLDWQDVKPICEEELSDQIHVITFKAD